jgi:hypothetical protein
VVVVDDGSSDGTAEGLGTQKFGFELRVIRQKNSGPARARNAGVDAAQGRLLLFLDDDVEPTDVLVTEHLKSHELDDHLVVMGPLASLPHYRQPWVAWEQAKLEAQYASMLRGDWAPTFRQFWTGNASLGRQHVVAAGKFNTDYLRAEDVELGYRLHVRGLKFRFNPAAKGFHHVERSLDGWMTAHRSYGRLEPEIFSRFGESGLDEYLGGNWSRLHPATRWLVRGCLDHPRRHDAASFALQRLLKLEEATGRPLASDKACGALANLLYWRALSEAIGTERARQIMRRGDEMRRGSAG